ncbi:acyltransferase family protein [Actinoplanes sp. RD1]|uniref:acyltransferase family protein n=1 Tax=Actinoplanes sp. RD1 TaxID=3064538 RepID=UPI002740E425|nr:acyltransferase family protein [Actinoplanes sp. RD1]
MTGRRTGLDAMRTVVVLGLVFFHAALVFDTRDDFYVKNARTTSAVTVAAGFAVVWAMPLLFTVAGIGARHSLRKRGPARFARERLIRLGVPLAVATVTIVPVPQWLRYGAPKPYWSFLTHRFFDVHLSPADFPFVVQGPVFETGHLWFVVLLLFFCPVLLLVPADRQGPDHVGLLLLLGAPIALISALVGLEESFAGWSRWAYLLFFLYGYLLAGRRAVIRRAVPWTAALGPACFLASAPALLTADDPFSSHAPVVMLGRAAYGMAGWLVVLACYELLIRRLLPRARGQAATAS